jgi:hypothetical protein
MKKQSTIRLIPYDQIDFKKWDTCINRSSNGLLYAYSWFLDSTCDKWDALVEEDYKAVFPLPLIRKKARYRLTPSRYSLQLGLFATYPISKEILQNFIDLIPAKYKKYELPLNVQNPSPEGKFQLLDRFVFRKDLIFSMDMHAQMSKSKLITDKGESMSINKGIQLAVIINFVLRICNNKVKAREVLALRKIISFCSRFGFGFSYGVYSSTNNLIGLSYLIRFHNRVYILFASTEDHEHRRKILQSLLDEIYKDFENQDLVLECIAIGDKELQKTLVKNGFKRVHYKVIKKRRRLF